MHLPIQSSKCIKHMIKMYLSIFGMMVTFDYMFLPDHRNHLIV